MADSRNRPDSKKAKDDWLTPPEIVAALGQFDLDPACHPAMPWRTADTMLCLGEPSSPFCARGDGLALEWSPSARVWLNPPWSAPLPWAKKMAAHGNGIWLSSAKSTDTAWGQAILESCDAVLFPAGRPLFHYPDGTKSEGKWTPVMLAAWGEENVYALKRISGYRDSLLPGPLFTRLLP